MIKIGLDFALFLSLIAKGFPKDPTPRHYETEGSPLLGKLAMRIVLLSLFSCLVLFPAAYAHADSAVSFSGTDHAQARAAYIAASPSTKEALAKATLKEDEIGIAKFDLNNDGVDEVLVYIENKFYCGPLGCDFRVYADRGGKLEQISPWLVVQKKIAVATTKHNGYRDIALMAGKKKILWGYDAGWKRYQPVKTAAKQQEKTRP